MNVSLLVWMSLLSAQSGTVEEVAVLKDGGPASVLAFSGNSKLLATLQGSSLSVWKIDGAEKIRAMQELRTARVEDLIINPEGTRAVLCSTRTLTLLDLETNSVVKSISELDDPKYPKTHQNQAPRFRCLTVLPDGKSIMTAYGNYGSIVQLSVSSLEVVAWLPAAVVEGGAFSVDGTTVATYFADSNVSVWRLSPQGGRGLKHGSVDAVSLNGDGSVLATTGRANTVRQKVDPSIRVWHAMLGSEIRQWKPDGAVLAMALAPAGNVVAAILESNKSTSLSFWSAETGKVLTTLKTERPLIRFSPNGLLFAYLGTDNAVHVAKVPPSR